MTISTLVRPALAIAAALAMAPGSVSAGDAGQTAAAAPAASASTPSGPIKITSIEIKNVERGNLVTISADGPVRYKMSTQANPPSFQLTFLGAELAKSAIEVGNDSGLLTRVKPTQQSDPAFTSVARVTFSLTKLVIPSVLLQDKQVIVEFPSSLPSDAVELAPAARSDGRVPTLGQKISVDVQGADVVSMLRMLSVKSGFDVVTTPSVDKSVDLVSLRISNQPLTTVLDIVLKARALDYEVEGSLIRVGTAIEILLAKRSQPTRTTVIRPRYVSAYTLAGILGPLLTDVLPPGKSYMIVNRQDNSLIVSAVNTDIARMRGIVELLDIPEVKPAQVIRIFDVNYDNAANMALLIKEFLSKEERDSSGGVRKPGGTILVDSRTNRLIVKDDPHNMDEIQKTLRRLDKKVKQVTIEAKFVEINSDELRTIGVNWDAFRLATAASLLPGTSGVGNLLQFGSVDSLTSDSASTGHLGIGGRTSAGSISPGASGTYSINGFLAALERDGKANILASPRLAVLDNQQARFEATSSFRLGAETIVNNVVTRTDTIITLPIVLRVRPQINQDNMVTLRPLEIQVSSADNSTRPNPVTRNAITEVQVRDGETLVIGGMVRNSTGSISSGVPLLKDIPVVGWLFKTQNDFVNKVELVIFLTPHIEE